MEKVSEIIAWLQSLEPDNFVGIDEGGLTLKEVRKGKNRARKGELTGTDYEIGGIPEEIENGEN